MPLPGRWLSALLLRCGRDLTLFDCGEGTQITWKMRGWGFRWVGAICLSHLHADHVMGLPGLLLQLGHSERVEPVHIYGPRGTGRLLAALRVVVPRLPYDLVIHELAGGDAFTLPGGLSGACLAVDHGRRAWPIASSWRAAGPSCPTAPARAASHCRCGVISSMASR
jgi:ribonuclease Z